MISHCLKVEEYKEVLNVNFYKQKQSAKLEYIQEIFNSCMYWDSRVIGINYFFSLAVESLQKENLLTDEIVDYIYSLSENANFEVQELMLDFIHILYSSYNSDSLTLEEKLIEIQNLIDDKSLGA